MAQGEIYVEVDASSINGGIMPMAVVSGNPEPIDGQAYVVVWLRWKYDDETGKGGFTGQEWFFDEFNILTTKFGNEDNFKAWLVDKKPKDLNDELSGWEPKQKAAFLNAHRVALNAGDCIYYSA